MTPEMRQYELYRGKMLTAQAVRRRLDELSNRNLLTEEMAGLLRDEYAAREKAATEELHRIQMSNLAMKEEKLAEARQRLLQVEKSTASDLFNQGVISEEVMRELRAGIDAQLARSETPPPKPEPVRPVKVIESMPASPQEPERQL